MQDDPGAKSPSNVVLIGESLRARREELKLTLDKVSQKTKISLNILRALEANDFASLPSPAYVKGFVLSYARVVGLSTAETITKLEYSYLTVTGRPFPALNHTKSMALKREEVSAEAEAPAPSEVLEEDRQAQTRRRVAVPALVFCGTALVFVGLYQLVTRTIEGETNPPTEKPYGPTFVPSSELVDIPAPKPAAPAPDAPVAEAPKPEEKPAEEKKTEKPVAPVRRNFPPKDFRKITVKLFAPVPDAPENQDEDLFPPEAREKFEKGLENVYLKAVSGNTWLSYQVDGGPIVSAILEKDKDLFLQGKEVLLFIGNVQLTKIFYQNRLIDAPSRTGFKSLIFPEANNAKHQLPLFPKAADDILYTAEEYQRRMKIEEEELPKP